MLRAPMLILAPMLIIVSGSLFAREPSIPSCHLSSLLNPGDTIYLDWNGKKIQSRHIMDIIDTGQARTFIVRTIKTNDDTDETSISGSKGNYNPISRKSARRTRRMIHKGEFSKAHLTGNLIELWPLGIRLADWSVVKRDNGAGGTDTANNKEYGVTTDKAGLRKAYEGRPKDPDSSGTFVDVDTTNAFTDMHSHPSGKHHDHGFAQPPSTDDISSASTAAYCTVFAMRFHLVYLYDRTGIIAVLPLESYINKILPGLH